MIHILFWNPDISSMTAQRMVREMPRIIEYGGYFNWCFWEYENVKPGDECFLVRCNDSSGHHGIVLKGKIISDPYVSQDWSGRGRKIYYADWYPQEFIDSEEVAPLSPDVLEREMPDFGWRGGHSGRPLPAPCEPVLERLWYDHLKALYRDGHEFHVNARANELTPGTLDFWKFLNA